MLIGIRIILPALLVLLMLACSGSATQPVPEPTATVVVTPTASPAEETAGSSGIFQCDADTPHPFQNVNTWTEHQPLHDALLQLPSNVWEQSHKERGLVVYFLPVNGTTENQWSAALTFYGYYETHIRDEVGLTWDEFVQQNLANIADDGDAVPNFRLVRQWEVEPKPMYVPGAGQFGSLPTIWDQRAEFRYGGVGDDTTVDGYGMSKRIGPYYYFVRIDVCANNRDPDGAAVVEKLFDSLSNSGYGNYW